MINILYSIELNEIKNIKWDKKKFKNIIKTNYRYILKNKKNNKTSVKKFYNLNLKYLVKKKLNNSFYKMFENISAESNNNVSILWITMYQQLYLSNFFKNNIIFKSLNARNLISHNLLAYITYSINGLRWKKYYILHGNEVIELLVVSLWLKDLKIFIKWMRKHFEKTNLKKHKKLFLLLKFLFNKFIWFYNIFFNLKGIRVVLLGKFGKAGSVRKTRKYIKKGKCSYTSKNIALINQTTVIRTITGVYSIKIEIFY